MIREASTMDKPINNEHERTRRRVIWIAAAAVILLGGIILAPSIGRWARSETSVSRAQIRTSTVARGDLIREVSTDGRVVAAGSASSSAREEAPSSRVGFPTTRRENDAG